MKNRLRVYCFDTQQSSVPRQLLTHARYKALRAGRIPWLAIKLRTMFGEVTLMAQSILDSDGQQRLEDLTWNQVSIKRSSKRKAYRSIWSISSGVTPCVPQSC
ncbi:hypothetical protein EVAR_96211_1 [Eumeta japonica]|uniref:Uncharacterized protein n=1 Tax=Eumeta variegata TaxID=151549 RepID=A0A4C1T683_EUMVA|nr:hypothetical protein EVAR_96211_1 [Eumeta japonica]